MDPLDKRQLDRAMIGDRAALLKLVGRIERRKKEKRPFDRDLKQLQKILDDSTAKAETRRTSIPKLVYDEELPVVARREEISQCIAENQVVVVCGETGSGKSTQLPKICLELGCGVTGMIGHTQPRRLAARSIATRLVQELALGEEKTVKKTSFQKLVGHKIRFSDETGPETLIKLMTDGILLAETQSDRMLEQYDTIILDEAHERSLNIDFLIGYLRRVLQKRPDLKLIITSATIDAERFAAHFSNTRQVVPVIEVKGRTYPVDILYRPLRAEDSDEEELDPITAVRRAVEELGRKDRGDMLVFLPTERDIHEAVKLLRSKMLPGDSPGRETEILPLYARLPSSQQQKIFNPGGRRRVVLATNVAESSLTVPRIHYVIDTGTARISRYSARSRTQRLPIEPISRASADQRTGRCGRVGPGVCVRLFDESDYLRRDRYTQPEIQRSNLASVILQAKSLRLGPLDTFPFLDPPKQATIRDGFKTLFEIGAIDSRDQLTPLGKMLSRLPVDPRIGRMILAADEEQSLAEVLIIAAALEVRDPRLRPVEKQQAADEAHEKFKHDSSDFMSLLKIWDFYHDQKSKLSRNQLRKACTQNFLSYLRMQEWCDIHRQLTQLVSQSGMKPTKRRTGDNEESIKNTYDAIHRAILAGLLSGIAFRSDSHQYTVAGNMKANLWPGSTLMKSKPGWVMAAEVIETERRYLRTCAKIDPAWLEPAAEHLVKRAYYDHYWSTKRGAAMTKERVTLFGLCIVRDRRKSLGAIDPKVARELLIRHGLVEGQMKIDAPFYRHNTELVEELESLQKKMRRHDLLRGDEAILDFYERRIPEEAYDRVRLDKWRKKVERDNPEFLFLSREVLLEDPTANVDREAFPDAMNSPSGAFPLRYEFAPGTESDGVTLELPPEAIGNLTEGQTDWLVPGLLEAKLAALIKTLPKPIRRGLIPAPDTARRVARSISFGEGDFLAVAAEAFGRIAGTRIRTADFDLSRLPDELRMNFAVVDQDGQTLTSGKDLEHLRQELGSVVAETVAAIDDPQWTRTGLTDWDFDHLPTSVVSNRGGVKLTVYPALVDPSNPSQNGNGETVDLQLIETLPKAERLTREALVTLFAKASRRDLRSQVAWLPDMPKMELFAVSLPNFTLKKETARLIASLAAESAMGTLPRTRGAYERFIADSKRNIGPATQDVAKVLPRLIEGYHKAKVAVEKMKSPLFEHARRDMLRQIERLTTTGFLYRTPWQWLSRYPVYFQAITQRIDRLSAGSAKRDQAQTDELAMMLDRLDADMEHFESLGQNLDAMENVRWMIEEYRISLFAQKLGTAMPISSKRIAQAWPE